MTQTVSMNYADLIARLQNAPYSHLNEEAADALTQLTAGDGELPGHPEPMTMKWSDLECRAIKDYGDRRSAAAVMAERERCAKLCENLGPPDGIKGQIVGNFWCAENIRKGMT